MNQFEWYTKCQALFYTVFHVIIITFGRRNSEHRASHTAQDNVFQRD